MERSGGGPETVERLELLRDRVEVLEDLSWLCRRVIGGGGGIFFCFSSVRLARGSCGIGWTSIDSGDFGMGLLDIGGFGDIGGLGGNGLFKSVTARVIPITGEVPAAVDMGGVVAPSAEVEKEGLKSKKETVCGALVTGGELNPFPCLCFGGGGGFFFLSFLGTAGPSSIRLERSSSSERSSSYDVRGDSMLCSAMASNMELCDIEDVSVLLLLSGTRPFDGDGGKGPDDSGAVEPVIRSRLKESTSNDALPGTPGFDCACLLSRSDAVMADGSISANVL